MRIYSSQYNLVASDIIRALIAKDLVEIEDDLIEEAELDVVGVIREYNRVSRQITQQSRDQSHGGDHGEANRLRRRLAKERGIGLGEDGVTYVIEQIIETLLASPNFEEIYAEDRELRAVITPIINSHSRGKEDELDAMVRSRIRNLEEGSASWDIEYERVMGTLRKTRGFSSED